MACTRGSWKTLRIHRTFHLPKRGRLSHPLRTHYTASVPKAAPRRSDRSSLHNVSLSEDTTLEWCLLPGFLDEGLAGEGALEAPSRASSPCPEGYSESSRTSRLASTAATRAAIQNMTTIQQTGPCRPASPCQYRCPLELLCRGGMSRLQCL